MLTFLSSSHSSRCSWGLAVGRRLHLADRSTSCLAPSPPPSPSCSQGPSGAAADQPDGAGAGGRRGPGQDRRAAGRLLRCWHHQRVQVRRRHSLHLFVWIIIWFIAFKQGSSTLIWIKPDYSTICLIRSNYGAINQLVPAAGLSSGHKRPTFSHNNKNRNQDTI